MAPYLCSFFIAQYLLSLAYGETTIEYVYPYAQMYGYEGVVNGGATFRSCWELCCEYLDCDGWQLESNKDCHVMYSYDDTQVLFNTTSKFLYSGVRGNCTVTYYDYPEVYWMDNFTTSYSPYKTSSSSSATDCLNKCIYENSCTFWEYVPNSSRCLLFDIDLGNNYFDKFNVSSQGNTIGVMDIGRDAASETWIAKNYQSVAIGASAAVAFAMLSCACFIFIKRKPLSGKDVDLEDMVQKSIHQAVDAKWEVPYTEITIVTELGTGAFGVVYKAIWRNSEIAVKQLNINASDSTAIKEFLKEANTVKNLRRHNNICGILGVCTNPAHPICILMEFVEGGTLESLIMEDSILVTPLLVIQFAKDICSGMSHIHQENILHCDLAARNLLVDKKGNRPIVKVTDFGLARNSKAAVYQAQADAKFPIRWSAPEVLMRREVSRAADVWSFAVVLWEILEARVPFYHLNNDEVAQLVCIQKQHLPKPKRFEYPGEIWEIMKQCWCMDPNDRPTFDTLYGYFDSLESNIGLTDSEATSPSTNDNNNNTKQRTNYGTARDSRYEDVTIPEELLSHATAYMSVRDSAFVTNDEPLPT